jgi:tetratricopeptide (TPR) repeat protein
MLNGYQHALEDLKRAIDLEPNRVSSYFNRGAVYYDLKDYQKAIADYDHALELNPRYTRAKTRREEAYHMLNLRGD